MIIIPFNDPIIQSLRDLERCISSHWKEMQNKNDQGVRLVDETLLEFMAIIENKGWLSPPTNVKLSNYFSSPDNRDKYSSLTVKKFIEYIRKSGSPFDNLKGCDNIPDDLNS